MGKLADAVRDQLQDTVQVQDTGDAASCRVERGQLVRSLARPGPRPCRAQDDLQPAGTFVDGEDGGRRRIQLQSRENAIAETKVIGAQAGSLGPRVGQASRAQLGLGQRRRLQVQMPAAQSGTDDDMRESRIQQVVTRVARLGVPCLEGLGHLAQPKQTRGVLADVGRRMPCAHRGEPNKRTVYASPPQMGVAARSKLESPGDATAGIAPPSGRPSGPCPYRRP